MSNLMQPLKLQLAASYKIYLVNLIIIVIGTICSYFFGNNSIDNYAYILGFEVVFTFVMGVSDYAIVGKTYTSLKHDRRLFTLSSIIMNLSNAIFMLIFYFLCLILTKNQFNVLNVLNYLFAFISLYTLANTYALLVNKFKIVNYILLISLALVCLLFGHITREILVNITNTFIVSYQDLDFTLKPDIAILINFALAASLNVLNTLKYNKSF